MAISTDHGESNVLIANGQDVPSPIAPAEAETPQGVPDHRAHVSRYGAPSEFPFEVGETVWIVKPELRSPLGQFRITKALPNDFFELEKTSDRVKYGEPVAKRFLSRNPFGPR